MWIHYSITFPRSSTSICMHSTTRFYISTQAALSECAFAGGQGEFSDKIDVPGKCGDRVSMIIEFVMDTSNTTKGLIVQEVTFVCQVADCKDCPVTKETKSFEVTFWEAKEAGPVRRPNVNVAVDEPSSLCKQKTCGKKTKTGTAKFFYITARTGVRVEDFKKLGQDGKAPFGDGICSVSPQPGGLFTDKEPAWFKDRTGEKPATRTVEVKWTCECKNQEGICEAHGEGSPPARKTQ